ncbi:Uncharacterised protein [Mycobacteroides abscessus subsp. abscessus]|uniref:hypothetical protein n=1 Tax=Mycobacteroides abscessus TaxID=36809 RepID=UPI00092B98CC|nr:hypothetical protein [Mycobacteroides abscessus]SHU28773.1 Uncharacterised protein [Mycobacteroides abscessus subsp. abscessus]
MADEVGQVQPQTEPARFKKGDLLQIRSEMDWNPSLYRVRHATRKRLVLGQLSDTRRQGYIGLDVAFDLTDPEDVAELVPATAEILALYPIHVR